MEKPDAKDFSEIFKALGDETRVKIMQMLNTRPRAVGEIVDFFSLTQSTISRHLSVLKNSKLVVSRRKGSQVIYGINEATVRDRLLGFFEAFECVKGGTSSAGKKGSGKGL